MPINFFSRNHVTSTFALLAIFAASSQSFAQTAVASPGPSPTPAKPVVTKVNGQPVTVDFLDGRVAVVKVSRVESTTPIASPFQVFDNSCSENRGMACTYKTSYRKYFYFLVWKQHSDAAKINQLVREKRQDGTPGMTLEGESSFTGTELQYVPLLTAGMSPPTIECGDFSWLPDKTQTAPSQLNVVRWDGELMNENPETLVTENRTAFGAGDVGLTAKNPGTLAISKIGYFSLAFNNPITFLMIGDVVTLSMRTGTGEMCQAELKPQGIAALQAAAEAIEKTRLDPITETNLYIYGSDENTTETKFKLSHFARGLRAILEPLDHLTSMSLE